MLENKDYRKIGESSSSLYDIEIFNLTKKYKIRGKNKEITALKNVNLKVKKGEIFGLLGPNGAGKTTMISILTTLIQPTSGYAILLGHNILKEPKVIKRQIGLMLGGEMIYYRLTGYRNLKFFCKLYSIKDYKARINDLTEKLNISNWLNQYVENYSKGMKVKLALARVLLIDPDILFLDEPMLGLDPNIINDIIEILLDLNKTIFLTSLQMDIVQRLCNRIAFLKDGEILMIDTQEEFKKLIAEKINFRIKIEKNKEELLNTLSTSEFIINVMEHNDIISFSLKNESYHSNLFKILQKYPISEFNKIEPNLNDVFVKLSS